MPDQIEVPEVLEGIDPDVLTELAANIKASADELAPRAATDDDVLKQVEALAVDFKRVKAAEAAAIDAKRAEAAAAAIESITEAAVVTDAVERPRRWLRRRRFWTALFPMWNIPEKAKAFKKKWTKSIFN